MQYYLLWGDRETKKHLDDAYGMIFFHHNKYSSFQPANSLGNFFFIPWDEWKKIKKKLFFFFFHTGFFWRMSYIKSLVLAKPVPHHTHTHTHSHTRESITPPLHTHGYACTQVYRLKAQHNTRWKTIAGYLKWIIAHTRDKGINFPRGHHFYMYPFNIFQ